jgi:hypothetical protein
MNPLHNPLMIYLRAAVGVRLDKLRTPGERNLGVSAIEWAIITGMLAAIAALIFVTIRDTIQEKANNIKNEGSY